MDVELPHQTENAAKAGRTPECSKFTFSSSRAFVSRLAGHTRGNTKRRLVLPTSTIPYHTAGAPTYTDECITPAATHHSRTIHAPFTLPYLAHTQARNRLINIVRYL